MSHPDEENEAMGYPSPMIWTTLDKRRIPIPEMEDSHLLNVIAYLRRRAPGVLASEQERWAREDFADMLYEIAKDGYVEPGDDAGSIPVDYEKFLLDRSPQYPYLLAEATKRGLTVPNFDWSDEHVSVLLAEHTLASFPKE